jgi:hypothetical protein
MVPFDAGIDLGDNYAGCGDGVVSDLEDCDCGDGRIPVPQGCIAPNGDDVYAGCTTRCLFGPHCGDGKVNGSEDCDLGALNGRIGGDHGCTFDCGKPHYCGDRIVDATFGEECDLGPLNGVTLDEEMNPTTGPRGMVYCDSDCRWWTWGY